MPIKLDLIVTTFKYCANWNVTYCYIIYRIRWIRLRVRDEIYLCIHATIRHLHLHIYLTLCSTNACREKPKSFVFLIALQLFDSFLFVDFVYCRPSHSQTYKNFMIRSKVLLLLVLLAHTHDLTEIYLNNSNIIHTYYT